VMVWTRDPTCSVGPGMSYRFIDHTGDVAVDLQAPDVPTLFGEAASALTDTLVDRSTIASAATCDVRLEAPDLEVLLVDWLSDLLFRFESEGWLTRDARVQLAESRDGWSLEATAYGEAFDPDRHAARVLVKAVTYHGLAVLRTSSGVSARVVFDI